MIQVSSVTGTRTPVLDGGQAGQSGWIFSRRACCAVGTNTQSHTEYLCLTLSTINSESSAKIWSIFKVGYSSKHFSSFMKTRREIQKPEHI